MKSAKEFVRAVVYTGESSENYIDARVRIYKNLNRKASLAIPSDSVELAIKREHLQTFTCLCCCEQNIQILDPEEFGWKLAGGQLKPLWFNGEQFPPSITRRMQRKKTDGNDADSESNDPDDAPPKKKPRA